MEYDGFKHPLLVVRLMLVLSRFLWNIYFSLGMENPLVCPRWGWEQCTQHTQVKMCVIYAICPSNATTCHGNESMEAR